jgi:hypothetical protein
MQTAPSLVLAIAAMLAAAPVLADPLAYVRASSQKDLDGDRSLYHPLNLLDDDPATLWCEGKPGLGEGEEIRFYFKTNQKIDRIVIGPTPLSGRKVLRVKVTDGANNVNVDLDDVYVERALRSPLSGTNYTVSIERVGGPNEGSKLDAEVACLADVLMYYKQQPFGGRLAPAKLRYDKMKDRVLGRWSGAPLGASESFIIFALDGTWEWTFEPLLGGKSERMAGEYRFRGNRLLMRRGETGRWSDMGFSYEYVKVDPDDIGRPLGNYDLIKLNTALGDKIANDYNNAEF